IPADQRGWNAFTFRDDPARGVNEHGLRKIDASIGPDSLDALGCRFLGEGRGTLQQLRPFDPRPRRCCGDVEIGIRMPVIAFFPPVLTRRENRPVLVGPARYSIVSRAALPAKNEWKERL